MKKYIAFFNSSSSGIQTKEKAIEWAANQMAKNTAISEVHICEVVEVVERTEPAVRTRQFFTQLESGLTEAKAA